MIVAWSNKADDVYDETEAVAKRLRDLGLRHRLHGKRFHDANIAAAMSTHGVRTMVTENADWLMQALLELRRGVFGTLSQDSRHA